MVMCGHALGLVYQVIWYFWALTGDLNGAVNYTVQMLCGS